MLTLSISRDSYISLVLENASQIRVYVITKTYSLFGAVLVRRISLQPKNHLLVNDTYIYGWEKWFCSLVQFNLLTATIEFVVFLQYKALQAETNRVIFYIWCHFWANEKKKIDVSACDTEFRFFPGTSWKWLLSPKSNVKCCTLWKRRHKTRCVSSRFRFFRKMFLLRRVWNCTFLPGMLGWRCCRSCTRLVRRMCDRGLCRMLCLMTLGWQR